MARNRIAEKSANLRKQGKGGFLKNIVKISEKAQKAAEDSINVKESTVTNAKESFKRTSKATLGGMFAKAIKYKKPLQFNNMQSYRTITKDDSGKEIDNELAPEKIPNDVNFGNKETINKERISSTAIDNINYNPKKKDLIVQFKNNAKKYLFPKVPQEVVKEWLNASSKGRFYNKNVKQYSVAK